MTPAGLEPASPPVHPCATAALRRCVNHRTMGFEPMPTCVCAPQESNLHPHAYQTCALPSSYGHKWEGAPYCIRTPSPLGNNVPRNGGVRSAGLEPAILRLKGGSSTTELRAQAGRLLTGRPSYPVNTHRQGRTLLKQHRAPCCWMASHPCNHFFTCHECAKEVNAARR